MSIRSYVIKERGYWVRWVIEEGKVRHVTYGTSTNREGDWDFPWHPGGVEGWANDRIREKGLKR